MDRALDDLVGSRGGNRRGGGGAIRRRGGFATQQRRQGGFGASFQHDDRSGGDAMEYDDDRTGGGVQRRTRGARRTTTPYSRSTPGSIETSWKHDMYQDEEEFEDFDDDVNEAPRGLETGTKLQITNLAYSVLSEDLKDLFESVGDIKRATVHFDKSGRSLGKATVVFSRRGDAVAAVKKYNNVPLDDQPMKISLLGNAVGGGRSEGIIGNAFRAIHDEALTISVGAPRARRVVSGGLGRQQRRFTTGRTVRVGGGVGGGVGFRGRTGGRGRGRGGAGRQVFTVTL